MALDAVRIARHVVIDMRNLIIMRGSLYWTGETWAADVRLAYRYSALERDTLELPRGGLWTCA